jgi:hypothetical protein
MFDKTGLTALWLIEQALHDCQYVGVLKLPQPGLRLTLAHLWSIAGDDPGVGPKTREPFDRLYWLVIGADDRLGMDYDRVRSGYARTEYARIRRMIRYPQTLENDERLRKFMSA